MTTKNEPSIFFKSTGVDLVESAFRLGVITVNELRKNLGLKPVKNGDVNLEKKNLDEYWEAK